MLCLYLLSVTPSPFVSWEMFVGEAVMWTLRSVGTSRVNWSGPTPLCLQIASVFSCTVGRRPLWLFTKVVIDLDFTKFVWTTRDYNKSSKIWQGWFRTYQSWTRYTKSENLATFPERSKEKSSCVAHPSLPTQGRDIIGLLFSQPGFRLRMGWAANSASRHPDSTSIRASALQPIAFISHSLDLVASRQPTLILEKDSFVQKLEHHSHSQHNIFGRKSLGETEKYKWYFVTNQTCWIVKYAFSGTLT